MPTLPALSPAPLALVRVRFADGLPPARLAAVLRVFGADVVESGDGWANIRPTPGAESAIRGYLDRGVIVRTVRALA